jgi:mRNA interferase MazF
MQRGEVWWVEFDERRPVVLLSEDESSQFVAMQVVPPAGADISDLGVEVAVGVLEGLPFEGVLRFGFPWPGFTPCTWLTTLRRDDLIERAGALSSAKLSEIDDALRAAGRRTEWTPAAAAPGKSPRLLAGCGWAAAKAARSASTTDPPWRSRSVPKAVPSGFGSALLPSGFSSTSWNTTAWLAPLNATAAGPATSWVSSSITDGSGTDFTMLWPLMSATAPVTPTQYSTRFVPPWLDPSRSWLHRCARRPRRPIPSRIVLPGSRSSAWAH